MTRLRRSDPQGPGFHRVKTGRGFSFRDEAGTAVNATVRTRIDALVIPPAWTDVWIAPAENAHIQATGTDAAGRRQYIYHADWRKQKDRTKFERALSLAESLPSARRTVTRDLRGEGRTRTLAVAFRMLDIGSLRVGSERYAEENGSHGLSTLLCAHATVSGDRVRLDFPAKSGKTWSSELEDADLASAISALKRRGPTARLLAYFDRGDWHPLTAVDINDYVRECTGGSFTAKDFRTLRGTTAAAVSLARSGPASSKSIASHSVAQAMRDAAAVLGNTPAIAKRSYVDPRVVAAYRHGSMIDPGAGRSIEGELLRLLRA